MSITAADVGAVCFGVVVGWITYRTLVRTPTAASLSDIATVIGAIGGAAVVGLFADQHLFGLYSVGLATGFFGYLATFYAINGRDKTATVMGAGQKPVKVGD
ncbi:MAG: hypothetical protein QOC93_2976 [Actinomycetota bacterium]|jgi:hypothetical protein|nr:hypothetical protein [Actinomycetota bacterium]